MKALLPQTRGTTVTFHSLDEILEAKRSALTTIAGMVKDLPPDRAAARAGEGVWSVADVLEHLCIVESQIQPLIDSLLRKAEAVGAVTPGTFLVSLEMVNEATSGRKLVTREKFEPKGEQTPAESLRQLHALQDRLLQLRPRIASVDPGSSSFPHWAFGPLTLGQWLAFVGFHEEVHLRQIKTILNQVPR